MELSLDDIMPFGKYKDTEIEEIMLEDPHYLLWAITNTDIEFDKEVLNRLEYI